ncbi:uncharacterized protein E0L32_011451 [Thyridium curvatum]|uniref:Uncharacterized protein n=1 Tax=Thyridium curvatum TaxID=1093900 RepID=A0A507BHI8_9PEZI|nr:uncharacterized protein E0L32_011451 [Thyridium curvatum]TPX18836.1 hypothetical protein E0L32_011451 [Thyridium curvatum]
MHFTSSRDNPPQPALSALAHLHAAPLPESPARQHGSAQHRHADGTRRQVDPPDHGPGQRHVHHVGQQLARHGKDPALPLRRPRGPRLLELPLALLLLRLGLLAAAAEALGRLRHGRQRVQVHEPQGAGAGAARQGQEPHALRLEVEPGRGGGGPEPDPGDAAGVEGAQHLEQEVHAVVRARRHVEVVLGRGGRRGGVLREEAAHDDKVLQEAEGAGEAPDEVELQAQGVEARGREGGRGWEEGEGGGEEDRVGEDDLEQGLEEAAYAVDADL